MSKKKKAVLPKRIGGVKVPKAVRKGRFAELLASRQGQALIAEAVMGAGALAAGLKAKHSPAAARLAEQAKDLGHDTADKSSEAGAAIAHAVGEAARAFFDALKRGEAGAPPTTGSRKGPLEPTPH